MVTPPAANERAIDAAGLLLERAEVLRRIADQRIERQRTRARQR
jgi:hypothetical protein